MHKRFIIYIVVLCLGIWGCNTFSEKESREVVARVNTSYLYKDEIVKKIPKNVTKEDSITLVQNYINRWATKQLFLDRAKLNLSQDEMDQYDNLVKDYKNTLYTNGYKNAVISKAISKKVSPEELLAYYIAQRENFKLKDTIVQLRYVQLPTDHVNVDSVKEQLERFNEEDKMQLSENKLQYISHTLADSLWVKWDQMVTKIPKLKTFKKREILKKQKTIQIDDTLGVYLVKINKVLYRNDIAPLEYIKPTIEEIIINKRKQELVRKLEKDITKDAIKNKQFEIYN